MALTDEERRALLARARSKSEYRRLSVQLKVDDVATKAAYRIAAMGDAECIHQPQSGNLWAMDCAECVAGILRTEMEVPLLSWVMDTLASHDPARVEKIRARLEAASEATGK